LLAGDILSLDERGDVERRNVGSPIAAVVRPRVGGGAVIGTERGIALEEPGGCIHQLPEVWSDHSVRMNEGGCDPDGRFYCGSMAYDQTKGAASLYRFDRDRSVSVVLPHVTISNGIEWSPDGSRAYYNDTDTRAIAVFAYDSEHGLTDRRQFVAIPDGGNPDGLTVDRDGGVWTAIFNRGVVHRYSPEGTLVEVIDLPARQVTACTFGGSDLSKLFITTSRENLKPGEDPNAGSLFVAEPGVRGMPVREFAG
jgi:sugar lactone lactonase YvrE